MRRVDFRWTLAVFAVLLLSVAGPALAQLQTGDLYGTVVDQQGQPLPGATISLEGIGAPQLQVSDENGQFRFLGLYPGTYKMRAELEGFSTLEYPDILIRVGGKTTMEVTLTSAVEDVITVTGESPIIDERRLNQGTSVPAVELDKVPTARDPWSLLSQTPGVLVDRFNVGGNESGQQSAFVGYGSTSRDNVFAVDGVILTDMNAVGASATYFDFGAFEEVQLTVSSTDVTIATSGVTINQVTKRGTNEWRGQGRYLRTDGGLQSESEVLLDAPARNPEEEDVFITGNEIDSVEEYGADIGGPLWQDHLWIWASYGESDIRNIVGGGQLDHTKLEDLNTKMNFQIGQNNSGVLHYWTNDKLKFGRGAGPTRSPETTHSQTTPQDIYKIEDTYIPSSSFFVTGLWSRDDGIFTLAPQGGVDADIFEDEGGVLHGTYYDFRQDAIIDQGRLNASYFFDLGKSNHELKFGGGFREQENHSGTVWPHGKLVQAGENFDNTETEFVTFYRDRQISMVSSYDSAWLQDTVTLDRWTINAGVRYDKQTVENLASSTVANPYLPDLIPALSFSGNDAGGFEWETVVPRVGVTYALGEERTTLLRGTFSQYAEQLGQLPLANRVNPMGYAYAYFYFTDANHNLVLDPNEFGSLEFYGTYNIDPDNPSALFSPNVNDPNLDPTMTDELTLGVEHALRTDLALGVNLIYRNIYDIPETRILVQDESGQTRFANRNDWVSSTITRVLPDGRTSGPIPVYNLRSGLTANGGRFYTNGDREQNYRGISLTLNKRLANRWSMRGHFTYADWTWDIGPEYRFFEDPTDEVADDLGFADGDGDLFAERSGGNKADVLVGGRWSFNVNGFYQVAPERPWGFNIGGSIDGREGYITPPFASRPGPAGSRRVQLTPEVDEFRHDDVIVLNLHLDKDFTFGEWNLNLGLDGFNLTNENAILQQQRNAGNDLNGVRYYSTEALSPRVFRGGVTLRFR